MPHKKGEDRQQMYMFSLDSVIAPDCFVRVVDAFADAIDLKSFGFAIFYTASGLHFANFDGSTLRIRFLGSGIIYPQNRLK